MSEAESTPVTDGVYSQGALPGERRFVVYSGGQPRYHVQCSEADADDCLLHLWEWSRQIARAPALSLVIPKQGKSAKRASSEVLPPPSLSIVS